MPKNKTMNLNSIQSQLDEKVIQVYWWNLGTRTKEFDGTISEYLKKKGITWKEVSHKNHPEAKGIRYNIPIGSAKITYEDFSYTPAAAALNAIQFFLTVLGDKATIRIGIFTIKVNH